MAWPTIAVRLFNSLFRCFSTGTVPSCRRWKIFINEQAESLLILISLNFSTRTLDRDFSDIIENDFHLEIEPRYHDERFLCLVEPSYIQLHDGWRLFAFTREPPLFFIMLRDWFVGSIFIMHVYPLGIEPMIINWTWERERCTGSVVGFWLVIQHSITPLNHIDLLRYTHRRLLKPQTFLRQWLESRVLAIELVY